MRVSTGATIPDVSNRLPTTLQPCARPTLHFTSPPEALLGERLLSSFQILCSQGASRHCFQTCAHVVLLRQVRKGHFISLLLSELAIPCFRLILQLALSPPSTYSAPSFFKNPSPSSFTFILSLERAPIRAGCIGKLFSVHSFVYPYGSVRHVTTPTWLW